MRRPTTCGRWKRSDEAIGKSAVKKRGRIPQGEYAISVAVAAVLLVTVLVAQHQWQISGLKEVASSAEEYIITKASLSGRVPDIPGFETVQTFVLGHYRAGLYRVTPTPLAFALGRFVIYDRDGRPAFALVTLEGSKDPWTALYDFVGRHGLQPPGRRARPSYTRSLAGNGEEDVVVGQYSGGDRCCTTATVIELARESVKVIGKIEGLKGMPFAGLDFQRLKGERASEIIAHRRPSLLCRSNDDAADLVSIYAYTGESYTEQTSRFAGYFEGALRENLARWSRETARSLGLLQTLAINYTLSGKMDQAKVFLAETLPDFSQDLEKLGLDSKICQNELEAFLDQLVLIRP